VRIKFILSRVSTAQLKRHRLSLHHRIRALFQGHPAATRQAGYNYPFRAHSSFSTALYAAACDENGEAVSASCRAFQPLRRVAPMMKQAVIFQEDQPFTLASLSPGRSQKRLALAVILALLGALFVTAGQLSAIQLERIDAFVPAYGTAVFVNDLITAVLLFNQFSILRSRALLAISTGYLCMALMVIPWMLTFPGVFAPGGLLGAGLQSTNWLYVLRYGGFPTFVMAYALLKDADPPKRLWKGSVGVTIFSSVAVSSAVVWALTVLVTAGDAYLPRISIDPVHFSTLWLYLAGCLILWNALALILLWIRQRSVLDLWLMVVVCAYAIEIYLVSFPGLARFSAGWYAGRIFGFVSSSLLLFVLMHEITTLYAHLLRAVLAQRREREARLMTGDVVSASIAHEVKQPLTAIIASANAGLNWLDRVEPDLDELRLVLRRVVTAGHHADAVIENIRAHFKKSARTRTSLDINGVIQEALAVVRDKLQTHRVAVQIEANKRLPRIRGEQVQLQQVLLNLITNAIDSMATKNGERVLSIRSEVHHSGCVMVSVEDTGKGLEPSAMDRIFNPTFTTKAHGMGMGLSICRSIIEEHEGQLWVTADKGRGAVFQFTVPVDPGSASADISNAFGQAL
jgi:signal transduction histidine kinase